MDRSLTDVTSTDYQTVSFSDKCNRRTGWDNVRTAANFLNLYWGHCRVGEDGRWGEMYKGEQAVEVMIIRVMLPQQNPRQRASHRVVRSSVSEVGDADDN